MRLRLRVTVRPPGLTAGPGGCGNVNDVVQLHLVEFVRHVIARTGLPVVITDWDHLRPKQTPIPMCGARHRVDKTTTIVTMERVSALP